MAFDFGGGFNFGSGFSLKEKAPNPLENIQYTGNLEQDSFAELEALRSGMLATEEKPSITLVFADRDSLDSFMWRRHLDKKERFFEGQKAVRAMKTPQANEKFSAGGGFSLKQQKEIDADKGWIERAKNEKKRFTFATDPEYYCVITFDTEQDRQVAMHDLGLDDLEPLQLSCGLCLSGNAVDALLP